MLSWNLHLAFSLRQQQQLQPPLPFSSNHHILLLSRNRRPVPFVPFPRTRTCPLLVCCPCLGSSSDGRRNPMCRMSNSDLLSQLELEKPDRKPVKLVNGIFWILLLNLGIFAADHLFQVRGIQSLYLYHNRPTWYQFVTATFCHADGNHLSSNLFFLYIFGKLVEEEEGNLALWFAYILTGAGANLVSWLLLPRNSISVGASGAVFGLFSISVLVKMSWDWRKILEVLILGQFVIKRVMEAAQASATLSSSRSLQNINHIAHLSGALVGVFLVWLLSRFPAEPNPKS